MKLARPIVILLLLSSTLFLLTARGDSDYVPTGRPLSELPQTIGSLSSTDVPLDQEVLDVLGKGYFLNRVYQPTDPAQRARSIGLFIGYFPTQRTGQAIHSPQNCLPGAGWNFDSSGVTQLSVPGEPPLQVGEYIISNGTEKAEVLYWYRSHGRNMASDYVAKFYTIYDSIRYRRTDAALIRVVTPVLPNESSLDAHNRAISFAQGMVPLLHDYIPD